MKPYSRLAKSCTTMKFCRVVLFNYSKNYSSNTIFPHVTKTCKKENTENLFKKPKQTQKTPQHKKTLQTDTYIKHSIMLQDFSERFHQLLQELDEVPCVRKKLIKQINKNFFNTFCNMKLQQCNMKLHETSIMHQESPTSVKGPLGGPAAIHWGGSVSHLGMGRCVQVLSQVLERNCNCITNASWEY